MQKWDWLYKCRIRPPPILSGKSTMMCVFNGYFQYVLVKTQICLTLNLRSNV